MISDRLIELLRALPPSGDATQAETRPIEDDADLLSLLPWGVARLYRGDRCRWIRTPAGDLLVEALERP